VCDAVAYAHSRGVIHRDIKPENVMLGDFGEVLLMDWGLAVYVGTPENPVPKPVHMFPGGTPAYMPPEMAVAENESIGFTSDVYLCGAVLFEIITSFPPHDGETVLECMTNAAANRIRNINDISELLNIAYKAMATSTTDRYASIRDFQTALRSFFTHSYSIKLAARADEQSVQAVKNGDYNQFSRAVFLYEESLKQWPGNRNAVRGLKGALFGYAQSAKEKGDIDLAESILYGAGMTDTSLGLEIRKLKEKREKDIKSFYRDWRTAFAGNFEKDKLSDKWDIQGALFSEVKDNRLHMSGGAPMWALIKQPFWGDIRLSFKCRQDSEVLNDVSAIVGGYQFKYGGWYNARSVIMGPDESILWSMDHSPLKTGEVFSVVYEKRGISLSMSINGIEIGHAKDTEMGQRNMTHQYARAPDEVALFGWEADTWYWDIKVEMLGAPEKADLLDTAERFLHTGRFRSAKDLFEDIAESAIEPERAERARIGIRNAEEAISMWSNAVEARDNIEMARAWLKDLFGKDVPPVLIKPYGLEIDLSHRKLDSLPQFDRIPIHSLKCCRNNLDSIDSLSGMKLTMLWCDFNRLESLSCIKFMPLNELRCGFNRLASLEFVKRLNLKTLSAPGNRITNIKPLSGMHLDKLYLESNDITDLSPLKGQNISEIQIDLNPVLSLNDLAGMPCGRIMCDRCGLSEIEALKGMPLRLLYISNNAVTDISPVKSAPLERLECQGNRIHDFSFFKDKPRLEYLNCSRNPVTSLEPFYDNPPVTFVFDCETISVDEIEKAADRWSGNPEAALALRHAEIIIALRRKDVAGIKKIGYRFNGHTYLFVPVDVPWNMARKLCEELGGHLLTVTSADEMNFVCDTVMQNLINDLYPWIGLKAESDGPKWITGEEYLLDAPYYLLGWEIGQKAQLLSQSTKKWFTHVTPAHKFKTPIKWTAPFIIEWES
jgi:hypothetical protein